MYNQDKFFDAGKMSQTELIGWIEAKLQERNWRPADLARGAGVPDATISRILNGNAKAGPELCTGIAQAFGVRPEKVFRLAGLLPPSYGKMEDLNEEEFELLTLYRALKIAEARFYVLKFLRGLVDQMKS